MGDITFVDDDRTELCPCGIVGSVFQCNPIRARSEFFIFFWNCLVMFLQTYFNARVKQLRLAALKKQKEARENNEDKE